MDYNIYIHDKTGGRGASPTVPNASPNPDTAPRQEGMTDGREMAGAAFEGAGWIAVAVAAAKIADAAVTSLLPFQARETGDYSRQYAWNDFKACIGLAADFVKNPIGAAYRTAVSVVSIKQNEALEEKRKSQERSLLGDSLINSWSGSI